MKIKISDCLAEELIILLASASINVMSDECREFKKQLEEIIEEVK